MILISSEVNDFSTNEVIDWLIADFKYFIRVNENDNYKIKFDINDISIIVNDTKINTNLIGSYWYRRGKLKLKERKIAELVFLENYLPQEEEILNQFLNHKIGNKKLNDFYTTHLNKLLVNELASEVNLDIPKTYILDNKNDIIKIIKNHSLITKGITQSSTFQNINNEDTFMSYTNRVTKETIKNLPNYFFPTLFQKEINKRFELRVFFLEDKLWSMAIFSQKDSKTEIDFRRYNNDNPNRTVPYLLPNKIENKLIRLMKKLNLNSGSIDMIVEKGSNKYYFLEVNPIGQFSMTSYPCNYNIEKQIANFLI